MPTIHLIVSGKVQGVFFRATAKDVADEIGITGWVKNADDGNVEAMAQGSEEQLQKFIDWCKKGPPKAIVIDVRIAPGSDQVFERFSVIRKWA